MSCEHATYTLTDAVLLGATTVMYVISVAGQLYYEIRFMI